jgi:hypothetical protein
VSALKEFEKSALLLLLQVKEVQKMVRCGMSEGAAASHPRA